MSATAETCLGTPCPRYDDCFVTRMRQRALEADIVVVNHHLLCADLAVKDGSYGAGSVAFIKVLEQWRDAGDLAEAATLRLRIPMSGATESLNVAANKIAVGFFVAAF